MSLDSGDLAAALRLARTRDGLLAIVDQVERRSRAALEGAFADADLSDPDHVVLLHLERLRWPPAVAAHVEVLRACLSIREAPDVPSLRDWLLRACEGTHPDRVRGGKFKPAGRGSGPIRKKIAAVLAKQPHLKNAELWEIVKARPPRGWTCHENRTGRYFEGPKGGEAMELRRFMNIAAEERKKLKNR